ncbi:MAG: type II toxin-antitoxin system VapC family toxin [Nitrososphaerales archaeon]
MRVIDSSSLSKYVNREPGWERVNELLNEGCLTLELALKEVGNSLWRRVMRGELKEEVALSAYKDFVTLRPFRIASQEGLYVKALEISSKLGIALYDALFIQIARDLNLQLVTSDEKQAEASRKLGVQAIYIQ